MITKGIVEHIIDKYSIKVRIPVYNKIEGVVGATPSKELSTASICTISHFDPNLSVGDIVFVGFEDNNTAKPIILGVLYKNLNSSSAGDLILNSLKVNVNTSLSSETTIGNITSKEISYLSGLNENIQTQIDDLNKNTYVKIILSSPYAIENSTDCWLIKNKLNMCNLQISWTGISNTADTYTLYTLPIGYRPDRTIYFNAFSSTYTRQKLGYINSNGTINIIGSSGVVTYYLNVLFYTNTNLGGY